MFLPACLLLALLPDGSPPGDPGLVEFRLQYLSVHARRTDTLTYDFDGDGRMDLLNVSVNFDMDPPERWLGLHFRRDGAFAPGPDRLWKASDRARALVFGDYLPGGGVEIGYIAEDGVYVYPWADKGPSETPLKLFHVRTFFRAASPAPLPVWSWASDLDGNGRQDLLVPLADGYRVYFQTAPGVFGRTATLEAGLPAGAPRTLNASARADRPEIVASHFVSTFDLPRVESTDINGDGLQDLVTIRKDAITCFLQKEPGVFPAARPYRVAYSVPTLREEVRKDSVQATVIRFVDIDRDRIADLVVTKIEGTLGLWDSIKTSIYLHMGTGRGNFVADRRILIDGVSIEPEFIDMNLDGKLDAVTSRLRTDLIKQAISAFVLGDITLSYEVFQFEPKAGAFINDPVYEKQIMVRKDDIEKTGAGAVPLVFIRGDLSGDGRPDMAVVEPRTSELLIHPGRAEEGPRGLRIGFDGTPHWRVKLERHPKGLQIMDVNGDGINDVLLYHPGALGVILSRRS